MTIHPIRLTGLVIGVPQTYEYLDKMQERVIQFIVQNSRIDPDALRGDDVSHWRTSPRRGYSSGRGRSSSGGPDRWRGGVGQAISHLNRLVAARNTQGGLQ